VPLQGIGRSLSRSPSTFATGSHRPLRIRTNSPPAFGALQRMRTRGTRTARVPPLTGARPAFLRFRRAVPRRPLRRTNSGLPSCPTGFLSPRQHSWAFTYRALILPEIEAASPRPLPPVPLPPALRLTARLRRFDPSEKRKHTAETANLLPSWRCTPLRPSLPRSHTQASLRATLSRFPVPTNQPKRAHRNVGAPGC